LIASIAHWFGLVFILVQSPDINVSRVAARVAQGGHDVPESRIRARWVRSLERLPIFARKASGFWVLDNSIRQGPMRLLFERTEQLRYVSEEAIALVESVETDPILRRVLRETSDLVTI
jgi:predicted ABC-type ATPase